MTIVMDYLGRLLVLIGLFGLMQGLCLYVALGLVVDKTLHHAEAQGILYRSDFDRLARSVAVLEFEKLHIEAAEPPWGVPCAKLGSPIQLTVAYHLELPMMGRNLKILIRSEGRGVNTGFYGSGY